MLGVMTLSLGPLDLLFLFIGLLSQPTALANCLQRVVYGALEALVRRDTTVNWLVVKSLR